MKYLRLELKVCEGCGVLWLRKEDHETPYCAVCSHQLSSFPSPKGSHAGGRPRRRGQVSTRTASRRCTGGVQ